MPRSLLVLGAITAASICGVWVHSTRAPVSRMPEPRAERAASRSTVTSQLAVAPAAVAEPVAPRTVAKKAVTERTEAPDVAAAEIGQAARIGDPAPGAALTIAEIQAQTRLETQSLVTIRNPDGSETLNHEDHFKEYTIIRVGAGGKSEVICVSGEAAARQALQAAKSTAPKKEGD